MFVFITLLLDVILGFVLYLWFRNALLSPALQSLKNNILECLVPFGVGGFVYEIKCYGW